MPLLNKINFKNTDLNPALENMLSYLPLHVRNQVITEVLKVISNEIQTKDEFRDNIYSNIFIEPEEATKNKADLYRLALEERDLALVNAPDLNFKQRYEQIVARNTAIFDQTTEETIKDICTTYSNGQVEIKSGAELGLYEIEFIGTLGIPDNIKALERVLEQIFPAHLGFKFIYRYVTWAMLIDKIWADLKKLTWQEVKTWKEILK